MPERAPGPLGLLHPLRIGDELLAGRVLQRATLWHDRLVFVVAGRRIVAEAPRPDATYNAQTSLYGIYADDPFDAEAERLVARLAERVRANERDHDPMGHPAAIATPAADRACVYLVPGHLGDPLDLTLRALHVLAAAGLVLVEPHKVDATRSLLERHGIPHATIAGLDDEGADRMRACLARGEDVAIFGVNEGIPGFCDPGKDTLLATDAPIRTVGGASVLGMALMRIPVPIDRFTFLGTVHSRAEADAAVDRWSTDLPAILFSWGRSLPDLFDRLQRSESRPVRAHLLVALTHHDERVISGTLPALRRATIGEREPVVVVLEPATLTTAWQRLRSAALRQRARARRLLGGRDR